MRFFRPCTFLLLAAGCFSPPPEDPQWQEGRTATTAEVWGCQYIGGYSRLGFRGEAAGMCATLVLVEAPTGTAPPGLALPPQWEVEAQSLVVGSCAGLAWRGSHEPDRHPRGEVVLAPGWAGPHQVDARFPTGMQRPEWVRLVGTVESVAASCLP